MSALHPLRTMALFRSSPTKHDQRQTRHEACHCKGEPMLMKWADAVQAEQPSARQADDPVQEKANPIACRSDAQGLATLRLHQGITVRVRVA